MPSIYYYYVLIILGNVGACLQIARGKNLDGGIFVNKEKNEGCLG